MVQATFDPTLLTCNLEYQVLTWTLNMQCEKKYFLIKLLFCFCLFLFIFSFFAVPVVILKKLAKKCRLACERNGVWRERTKISLYLQFNSNEKHFNDKETERRRRKAKKFFHFLLKRRERGGERKVAWDE